MGETRKVSIKDLLSQTVQTPEWEFDYPNKVWARKNGGWIEILDDKTREKGSDIFYIEPTGSPLALKAVVPGLNEMRPGLMFLVKFSVQPEVECKLTINNFEPFPFASGQDTSSDSWINETFRVGDIYLFGFDGARFMSIHNSYLVEKVFIAAEWLDQGKDAYFKIGTIDNEIEEGSDLNRFITPGNYKCSTDEIAVSIKHCPVDTGFRLSVVSAIGNEISGDEFPKFLRQEIYPSISSKGIGYVRYLSRMTSSSIWEYSDWEQIAEVSQIENLKNQVESEFASIDNSIESIETSISNLNTSVQNLDNKIDTTKTQLEEEIDEKISQSIIQALNTPI